MSATAAPVGTAPGSSQPKGRLLRLLGVSFGIAVIVGDTIGSGILRTPGEIAGYLGSRGLIIGIWLMGALYAVFCTLSVTELGTMLPFAGGWYVYSRRAMGDYAGFVVGCSDWVMQTATTAYLAVAFGEFAVALQSAFRGHVKLLAVGVLLGLTLLNWLGLRTGSRAQEAASLVKALALLAFVVACFIGGHNVTGANAAPVHVLPRGGLLLPSVMAIQAVIVTYDGWYAAIYFTEENKNAAKDLPRSSIGGVLACAAIFLLVNGALFHVLPMGQLMHSQMPVDDAAKAVLGSRGMQFILLVSLVTAISTINATFLMTPRILFAMGRDRLLPLWFTSVNARGSPTPALLIGTLLATVLAVSGSFETLIAICSILFVAVVYLSGFISLFVLGRREPNLPRPFRIWGYPWSNLGVLLGSSAFLVAAVVPDLKDTLLTVVLMGLACVVYFLFVRKRRIDGPTVLAELSGCE